MDRREFLKTIGILSAAVNLSPFINSPLAYMRPAPDPRILDLESMQELFNEYITPGIVAQVKSRVHYDEVWICHENTG